MYMLYIGISVREEVTSVYLYDMNGDIEPTMALYTYYIVRKNFNDEIEKRIMVLIFYLVR